MEEKVERMRAYEAADWLLIGLVGIAGLLLVRFVLMVYNVWPMAAEICK